MDAITPALQPPIVTPEQSLPMNTSTLDVSTSTLDPYTDQALLNPWPLYRELRGMGPVVWLVRYGMFALTRYDAVVKVLRDWEGFPSRFGVMMNDEMNQVLSGNTRAATGMPTTNCAAW
jgi:cytochrome P450